jgi:diguanylate cyclase (GGDEF)-like protein
VSIADAAADVMGLAQDGKVEAALRLAERALTQVAGEPPSDQAALWYSIAVARHILGDNAGASSACDRCLAVAGEADNAGWASNGLSMRAMAQVRQGLVEPALLDLARAEAQLDRCEDAGLRCWAHTGLGYCYLEMRLYELALPHMVAAQEIDASPIPLTEAPVIDLMNLAELHLRWADELERVLPEDLPDEEVGAHRKEGHVYAERALSVALGLDNPQFVATCRAVELCARPRDTAESSLVELREAYSVEDHPDYQGSRAVVGGALARALWATGEREEALAVATEAARMSLTAGDWQVSASAQWLLVEMQARTGMPGADAGRSYGRLLSRVLWQQRLSTLQGARAALQVETLHRDNAVAQRAASEDPLTGVGNRRALDETLCAVQAEASLAELDVPVSLLVIDLNDFKAINDTYGHVVGDEVLRAVATAIAAVARSGDVVARLGGDEFVVLARGADTETGLRLAERVTAAVDALVVGTSAGAITLHAAVGVATAGSGHDVGTLLAEADAAMYDAKAAAHDR